VTTYYYVRRWPLWPGRRQYQYQYRFCTYHRRKHQKGGRRTTYTAGLLWRDSSEAVSVLAQGQPTRGYYVRHCPLRPGRRQYQHAIPPYIGKHQKKAAGVPRTPLAYSGLTALKSQCARLCTTKIINSLNGQWGSGCYTRPNSSHDMA
jgi:hypothetical protein